MPRASRISPSELLLIAVAVPLLAILLGGVYSLPAIKLTKERDPWLTMLLALALAATDFGIGALLHAPMAHLSGVWFVSVVLLLIARKFYGGLGHSLERFGVVHAATLVMTFFVSVAAKPFS